MLEEIFFGQKIAFRAVCYYICNQNEVGTQIKIPRLERKILSFLTRIC